MGEFMDAASNAALAARRQRMAEQLVRDQVLAETFRDLPATLSSKLKGSYYQLLTSTSPAAFAAAWRR